MALTADLKVNGVPLGHVYIRRLSSEPPMNDDVSEYEWAVRIDGKVKRSINPVRHRYGDGALALIAKVIQEVSSMT